MLMQPRYRLTVAALACVILALPGRMAAVGSCAPTEIGAWGYGPVRSVLVVGPIAYIGAGRVLQVLDISMPASPIVLADLLLPGLIERSAISGSTLLVAAGRAGLLLVDVSQPSSPILVGQSDSPGWAYGVAAGGSLAYLADGSAGLRILDISSPSNPTLVATLDTPGSALDITLGAGIVVVADGSGGIRVIDVSNPGAPVEAGAGLTTYARGVELVAGLAYVADSEAGLRIFDVSVPSSPAFRGLYDTPGEAWDVVIDGSVATVGDGDGLSLISVAQPTQPSLLGSIPLAGVNRALARTPEHALVAALDWGLNVVDVQSPSNPTLVLNLEGTGGLWEGLTVTEGRLLASDLVSGTRILDVSDPATPVELGRFGGDGDTHSLAFGDVAYLLALDGLGFQILDISIPESPTTLGSLGRWGWGLEVVGERAYLAADTQGLVVVDVSSPAAPVQLGVADTPGTARGVSVAGNFAYIADFADGLQVVDISTPASPILRGSAPCGTFAYDVAALGQWVYLATRDGICVVDASNAQAPTVVQQFSGRSQAVARTATNLFVANGTAYSLEVYATPTPSTPTLLASLQLPSQPRAIAVLNDRVFVANANSGVSVIDVSGCVPIFADGFESGGLSAWSATQP